MRLVVFVLVAGGLLAANHAVADEITTADLLRRVIDLQRLSTAPSAGEQTRTFSSYDRRSRVDDQGRTIHWDANDDCGNFIDRTPDGWDLMAEVEGPGAITRIWCPNPDGEIRIVLDGETAIEADFAHVLSGELPPLVVPLVEPGLCSYFPMGFARDCQVMCRQSAACYQIDVVRLRANARVRRFTTELDEPAQAALTEVTEALGTGLSGKQLFGEHRTMAVAVQQDLKPGEVLSEELTGDGTVRALYVALTDRAAPRGLYALHRCILRVFVDGEDEPRVEVPLIDFFGSGFEYTYFNSLVIGTDLVPPFPLPQRRFGEDRLMYCYLPMPYCDGLRIEIENVNPGKKELGLLLHMRVDTRRPEPGSLVFNARYRREDPCKVLDFPLLEVQGAGRLVGLMLNIDCPHRDWWGEGDEKVWIDGEAFPSHYGTGVPADVALDRETGVRAGALQGVTRSGQYGKSSSYRWYVPDAIGFGRSVRATIENWRTPRDAYMGAVVYWYGPRATEGQFARLDQTILTPPGLRIPGSVEIEGHIVGEGWGSESRQRYAGNVELSGKRAASIKTTDPVRMTIPATCARRVRLLLRTNPRRSFATIVVREHDGREIGTVTYDRAAGGLYTVGMVDLAAGDNVVTVECSERAVLDCWILEPVLEGLGPGGLLP